MATILYARVSTAEQTVEHQRTQAEAVGFKIDYVIADNGVSGLSQGRLFDILRAGDTLVVRWIDRLGRNHAEVCDLIQELMRRGVVVRTVINDMTFHSSSKDPTQQAVQDALMTFMAASVQAQAETITEAQRAGIEHAKTKGDKYRGRKPSYTHEQLEAVRDMLGRVAAIAQIAKQTGLSRQTIYRIKNDPVGSEEALANWGLATSELSKSARSMVRKLTAFRE
jgi:DNA invertase Pin-like site-specific DNA recombinase